MTNQDDCTPKHPKAPAGGVCRNQSKAELSDAGVPGAAVGTVYESVTNFVGLPRKFDVILTNPPFQDSVQRGKTPHKLWIDFTRAVFARFLADGGLVCQVSPSSYGSPCNEVLSLMKQNETLLLRHDTNTHFPGVASSFSDYIIRKTPNSGVPTRIIVGGTEDSVVLDQNLFYIPNDLVACAIAVHRKVVFDKTRPRLRVEKDYITCHNSLLKRSDTLSHTRTERHCFPVFHTNRQIWWSSVRQPWADSPKVMWTRSGYTKPFFDNGRYGGTDMAYFVQVRNPTEGEILAHNLNLELMRYIYRTARWSGFGNERVFAALPDLPRDKRLTDEDAFALFSLTDKEVHYVRAALGQGR